MNRLVAGLVVVVLVFSGTIVEAGTYFVKDGGAGAGGSWGDAYGTIQQALDAVYAASHLDHDATVYVGKTGTPYAGAVRSFTNAITVRILGGYDPDTSIRDGTSEIAATGTGLQVDTGSTGGSASDVRIGNFTLSHFNIGATSYGLYGADTANYRYSDYVVSNCTVTTSSTTVSPITLGVTGSGGRLPGIRLYGSTVTTPVGNAQAAVYIKASNNATSPSTAWLAGHSLVVAAADGSGLGRNAAFDVLQTQLVIHNSVVTNTAAGYGAQAGRGAYANCSHEITNSTVVSSGNGVLLNGTDFSAAFGPVTAAYTSVRDSMILAAGKYGLRLWGWHGTSSDAATRNVLITNSTIQATGNEAEAVVSQADNGGAMDFDIFDSALHGKDTAFRIFGGGGNRDSDTLDAVGTTFSAGDVSGAVNGTNEVLRIASVENATIRMRECQVRNGRGGINLTPGWRGYLTVVNSVVTDQDSFAVRLDGGNSSSYNVWIRGTNSTFSAVGGPVVVWEDNGTSTGVPEGRFHYCAFAPGAGATNFVNNDTTQNVQLYGYTNAFYSYGTFSYAPTMGFVNSMVNNLDSPAGDAKISTENGYSLLRGTPLADRYFPHPGDPVTDIEGDVRPLPLGAMADIGADEGIFPPLGALIIVR